MQSVDFLSFLNPPKSGCRIFPDLRRSIPLITTTPRYFRICRHIKPDCVRHSAGLSKFHQTFPDILTEFQGSYLCVVFSFAKRKSHYNTVKRCRLLCLIPVVRWSSALNIHRIEPFEHRALSSVKQYIVVKIPFIARCERPRQNVMNGDWICILSISKTLIRC